MSQFSSNEVLKALSHVEDPDLKKDLVTLGMIKDLELADGQVSFTLELTTPACPLKDMLKNACVNAVHHFVSPALQVNINVTSRVTQAQPHSATLANVKNILLVSSGKGGVGKSTVAANLALALSMQGAAVGLIDADIYGPSMPTMFNLQGRQPRAIENAEGKRLMLPIEQYGIKVMSLGFFARGDQPVPWRGPMASNAVKQLFNDTDWGTLDYLVVDLPPGTGDIHITIAQSFPITGAVIVTTPQQVALADTRKGLAMFQMPNIDVPVLGVIENMAYFTPPDAPEKQYFIFGSNGGIKLAQDFDVPFLGRLPIVQAIGEAADAGMPIVHNSTDAEAQTFIGIAQKLAQQVSIANAQA